MRISWTDRWGLSVCLCQEEFANIFPLITNYTSERGFTDGVLEMWNSIIRDLQERCKIDRWHQTADKEARATRRTAAAPRGFRGEGGSCSGGGRGSVGEQHEGGWAILTFHAPLQSFQIWMGLISPGSRLRARGHLPTGGKAKQQGRRQLQLQIGLWQRAPQGAANTGLKKRNWRMYISSFVPQVSQIQA